MFVTIDTRFVYLCGIDGFGSFAPSYGTFSSHFQQKSIFTTSITDKDGKIEEETSDGLVTGHAYAILDTTRLKVGNDRIEMVKLRNPWAKAGIHGRPNG